MYEIAGATRPNPTRLRPNYRRNDGIIWLWGCLGAVTFVCLVGCLLTLVLSPLAFRLLPEELQARVAARLPFLETWKSTPDPANIALTLTAAAQDAARNALPTLDPARATAAAIMFASNTTPPAGLAASPTSVLGAVTPRAVGSPFAPISGATLAPSITPLPLPTATSVPLPVRYRRDGIGREPQAFNNCGPANLVQAMRMLNVNLTQTQTASWLKPNNNDANVSPWQMVTYVNQFTQIRGLMRHNGDLKLLKRLVYAGFGVIVETGLYDPKDKQWEGHYLTVIGWDDAVASGGGFLYGLDSYVESNDPNGVHEYYYDVDERWKHFNRVYIVLYPPDRENQVRDILGTAADEVVNAQEALNKALTEAQLNPNDPFAWFNAGSSYVLLGQWQQAATAYDRARSAGPGLPWRMLWYQFGPYVAYYNVGDYKTVIDLATKTAQRVKYIEETNYFLGIAFAAMGQKTDALGFLQAAASFNPNFGPAQRALTQLQAGVIPAPEVLT